MPRSSQLDVDKVKDIFFYIENTDLTRQEIAQKFNTTPKAVGRIDNGYTWNKVTGRKKPIAQKLDIATHFNTDEEFEDLKYKLGFRKSRNIRWGKCYLWNGVHYIITDGVLAWNNKSLTMLCKNQNCKELPYFFSCELLSQPIGDKFILKGISGKHAIFGNINVDIFIHRRYLDLINKFKLQIRQAGNQIKYVYLTRRRVNHPHTSDPDIIGCLATARRDRPSMEIPINEQKVSTRKRKKRDKAKLTLIKKQLLALLANEDIDEVFVAIVETMKNRGYNFKEAPKITLNRINTDPEFVKLILENV